MATTEKENKPAAHILRKFMAVYVQRKRRKGFVAEARRQSLLISASSEEERVMDWISDVTDAERNEEGEQWKMKRRI